ncbi:hypothetical protein TcWFU_009507 [Taenia crassiceps]|uniref:Uncharacterized protein n=1 Tax=Taenia crassiceps TaxID=6207 RepID=A0ABR4QK70_9CEST
MPVEWHQYHAQLSAYFSQECNCLFPQRILRANPRWCEGHAAAELHRTSLQSSLTLVASTFIPIRSLNTCANGVIASRHRHRPNQ